MNSFERKSRYYYVEWVHCLSFNYVTHTHTHTCTRSHLHRNAFLNWNFFLNYTHHTIQSMAIEFVQSKYLATKASSRIFTRRMYKITTISVSSEIKTKINEINRKIYKNCLKSLIFLLFLPILLSLFLSLLNS